MPPKAACQWWAFLFLEAPSMKHHGKKDKKDGKKDGKHEGKKHPFGKK